MTNVQELLNNQKRTKTKAVAVLIDPDKVNFEHLPRFVQRCEQAGVHYFFLGGSLISSNVFERLIQEMKALTSIPLIIFPGSNLHVHAGADAIFLLSLISGRNPEFLIGQHVVAAPMLKNSGLEIIATGYILVESGKATTVSYISNTMPIPSDKPDVAVCTALAGEMLGLRTLYLDAGSGALQCISTEMIRAVAAATNIPLIVGGGINSVEKVADAFRAGADVVVIGNAIEKNEDFLDELQSLVQHTLPLVS